MELSRATLGRWTGAVAELLEPLYDVLRQYVLMPGKVHADDIPVPVQEPGSGKTRTARLWVYVRDDRNAGSEMPPAVWFAYSPDRKGIVATMDIVRWSDPLTFAMRKSTGVSNIPPRRSALGLLRMY